MEPFCSAASSAPPPGCVWRFDYAYSWWLLDDRGADIVTAAGAQGQWIFAALRDRLVIAVTSANDDGRWVSPVDFLYSHILPAVR